MSEGPSRQCGGALAHRVDGQLSVRLLRAGEDGGAPR